MIIADIGVNHDGNFVQAVKLTKACIAAGVDLIKYQVFFHKRKLKHLELTKDEFKELFSICDMAGQSWFATPFDTESVSFLNSCNMKQWKIGSANVTDLTLCRAISKTNPESIIISNGMCSDNDLKNCINLFSRNINKIILYCVSKYPPAVANINLHEIKRLRSVFNLPVGFSDHFPHIGLATLAIKQYKAEAIEKHVTLDQSAFGPDHSSSMTPQQLKALVEIDRCL